MLVQGHLHWEDDARPDTSGARSGREALGVALRVEARRVGVAAKVGTGVAAEAALNTAPEISRLPAGDVA